MDVESLSDDQLAAKLRELGVDVGPILGEFVCFFGHVIQYFNFIIIRCKKKATRCHMYTTFLQEKKDRFQGNSSNINKTSSFHGINAINFCFRSMLMNLSALQLSSKYNARCVD